VLGLFSLGVNLFFCLYFTCSRLNCFKCAVAFILGSQPPPGYDKTKLSMPRCLVEVNARGQTVVHIGDPASVKVRFFSDRDGACSPVSFGLSSKSPSPNSGDLVRRKLQRIPEEQVEERKTRAWRRLSSVSKDGETIQGSTDEFILYAPEAERAELANRVLGPS